MLARFQLATRHYFIMESFSNVLFAYVGHGNKNHVHLIREKLFIVFNNERQVARQFPIRWLLLKNLIFWQFADTKCLRVTDVEISMYMYKLDIRKENLILFSYLHAYT